MYLLLYVHVSCLCRIVYRCVGVSGRVCVRGCRCVGVRIGVCEIIFPLILHVITYILTRLCSSQGSLDLSIRAFWSTHI